MAQVLVGQDGQMAKVREIEVPPAPLGALGAVIGEERQHRLEEAARRLIPRLGGATVWNLSSTATGGGVAEMLHVLLGYVKGIGVDMRWAVIEGDAEFFKVTKRLHNRLHGVKGDDGALSTTEAEHYEEVARANATALAGRIRPGDVVLLHDPQTAGLAPLLRDAGAVPLWRCHIGTDAQNAWSDQGWDFLRPYLSSVVALVFSRLSFSPRHPLPQPLFAIAPSIDPLSPKNQQLAPEQVGGILSRIGLIGPASEDPSSATFVRSDGSMGKVDRMASVVSEATPLPASAPLVIQVSRWDRLKDMAGVMRGFVDRAVGTSDAHLALIGPAVEGVTDDPEGAEVFAECLAEWRALPPTARRRVSLVTLPMDDQDENAAMVNALQRHASVVVQKSLVEGFGLTVAEAMWKGRPVIGSAVGGIIDQLAPGAGVLLTDPTDTDGFGTTLSGLLADSERLQAMGAAAHQRVREHFLGDRHLLQYAALLEQLLPSH